MTTLARGIATAPATVRSAEGDVLRSYARALVPLDIAALLAVVAAVAAARPGGTLLELLAAGGTATAWMLSLGLVGAYDTRFLGVGAEEFKRVLAAALTVVATVAGIAYLSGAEQVRGVLVATVIGSLAAVLVGRRLARSWLHRQRRRGRFNARALLISPPDVADDLADHIADDPTVGFDLVTTLPPPNGHSAPAQGGHEPWLETIVETVRITGADAVLVSASAHLDHDVVRALAWRLGGTGTHLLVAPALGDVAGPRTLVRSAPRLPLVHLEEARLTGPQLGLKRAGDLLAAAAGLVLMLPILLVVALAVRLTSPGPVLFRQERIGRDGRPFVITKFRTMVDGAEFLHEQVLGPPAGRDRRITARDPRITPLGRVLRRWSLDEFPQLWSVIRGDMSLVGPRPLMPSEMPWLEPMGQRRHLMSPGITGLWQVNGRKEVDWADRIRLDVDYVERWSPALDAVLLIRTVKAVLMGEGAR